jgi:heat shock protein HslJ
MTRFALLCLLALSAACETVTGGSSPSAASLQGSEWLLEDLAGAGVVERVRSTLAFPDPGRVAGNGGCNRFGGEARFESGAVRISQLAATRRACPPAVMDQEQRYLAALQRVERLALDGPYLLAYPADEPRPLRFSRIR